MSEPTCGITLFEAVGRLRADLLPEMKDKAEGTRGIHAFEAHRDVIALLIVLGAADGLSAGVQHIAKNEASFGPAAAGFCQGLLRGVENVKQKDVADYIAQREVPHGA